MVDLPDEHVGRLQVLAALSGLGDFATTTYLLVDSPDSELNVVIGALAAESTWLAVAAFAAFVALLVAASAYGGPWERRVAGAYLVLSMGSATVNNLVSFTTGVSMLGALGDATAAWLIAYGFPLAGLAAGTALAHRADELPRRRVLVGSAAVVAAMLALPALVR